MFKEKESQSVICDTVYVQLLNVVKWKKNTLVKILSTSPFLSTSGVMLLTVAVGYTYLFFNTNSERQ